MKIVKQEMIYPVGEGKTPSCHAATLIALPDGRIMAAWFGGQYEKATDVEIYIAFRSPETGWGEARMVSVPTDVACWNPVLFAGEDGEITLVYKRGERVSTWRSYVRRSRDMGETWSDEEELVSGDESDGRGPVKDKPILLKNGAWLAGASHESEADGWRAFTDLSTDGGYTWTRGEYVPSDSDVGLIQPTPWESKKGVSMLLRSNCGHVYRADSADMGATWCKAYPIGVPNNNSGLDLAVLPDGTLALVCNPVGNLPGTHKGPRTPLSLLLSRDDGETWEKALDIETSEISQYSYPAMIYAGGSLHVAYTWRRETMAYCEIAL